MMYAIWLMRVSEIFHSISLSVGMTKVGQHRRCEIVALFEYDVCCVLCVAFVGDS